MNRVAGEHPLDRPLIFPGRISHRRFHPKAHAFSYSYLLVCIPVGWKGCVNGFLSVDTPRAGSRGWLQVNAAGRLSRDDSIPDLRDKLDDYLRSQGVDPSEFPYAVLVCQPTVLGYQFNPASFWHLYDPTGAHMGLVVEVNNTFDERRMYFLRPSSADADPAEAQRKASRIAASWAKDFHVSPFNSRLGNYSIMALDPLASCTGAANSVLDARIDNTITLSTSEGSPKLVARAWSVDKAIDPSTLSFGGKVYFLLSWWWVGLVTFPRIVREAYRLFFGHGMHVWYRPEVLPTSTGRTATAEERIIESNFIMCMEFIVKQMKMPTTLRYTPPQAFGKQPQSLSNESEQKGSSCIDITITTPAFYSRLIHYEGLLNGVRAEVLDPEPKNRTAWCSEESAFEAFLNNATFKDNEQRSRGLCNIALLAVARRLRVAPAAMSYPWPGISAAHGEAARPGEPAVQLSHDRPLRDLVLRTANAQGATRYLTAEVRVFASERVAFGSTTLLAIECVSCVCLTCTAIALFLRS